MEEKETKRKEREGKGREGRRKLLLSVYSPG